MAGDVASRLAPFVERVAAAGALPEDSDELRLRKATLAIAAGMWIALAGVFATVYWLLGFRLAASIPIAYQAVSIASLLHFLATKRYRFFRFSQLGFLLVLPVAVQWSLGRLRQLERGRDLGLLGSARRPLLLRPARCRPVVRGLPRPRLRLGLRR